MFYKILTKEEKDHLKELRDKNKDQVIYEMEVEKYLREIGYDDRLTEYLDGKWYVKLIRWFTNRKKK